VNLATGELFAEHVLFGEDASRVVLSCDPAHVSRIKQIADKRGAAVDVIGETFPDKLEISLDGKAVVSATVSELREAYESALESALRTDPEVVVAD
jgi:phosphoribosylformylglycinamidine (FGAM) synthase-like enzyme